MSSLAATFSLDSINVNHFQSQKVILRLQNDRL